MSLGSRTEAPRCSVCNALVLNWYWGGDSSGPPQKQCGICADVVNLEKDLGNEKINMESAGNWLNTVIAERDAGRLRILELEALINSPQTADFLEAVRTEAAHQVERWGSEHDEGKSDADWFWLLGYLAGKAIRPDQSPEKQLHHIITTAAVCLNWHAHKTGERTKMRPGIDPEKAGGL